MSTPPIISLMVLMSLVTAAHAHQFPPHVCGEKTGSPTSVEHVDALGDDLLVYLSNRHQGPTLTVLLSCASQQGLVVETDKVTGRSHSAATEFLKAKQCAPSAITFEDLRAELESNGFQGEIRGAGFAGNFPFDCICETQAAGLHRKTVWQVSDHGLVPTSDTVGNKVTCDGLEVSR